MRFQITYGVYIAQILSNIILRAYLLLVHMFDLYIYIYIGPQWCN